MEHRESNLVRVSPSLFDENTVMIGRSKTDKTWKEFKWGENTDLTWEYCPITEINKALVGTTYDYVDVEENDNIKKQIEDITSFIDDLKDGQIGICAFYALYKYSRLVNKSNFTISDGNLNEIVSIMNNDAFKRYNDFMEDMKKRAGEDKKN